MSTPPTAREIADLAARLRALAAAGAHADPAERAAVLADKQALLARIADTQPRWDPDQLRMPDQMRADAERGPGDPVRPDEPAELAAQLAELRERVHDKAESATDPEQVRRAQLALWHTDDIARSDAGAEVFDDDTDDAGGWSR